MGCAEGFTWQSNHSAHEYNYIIHLHDSAVMQIPQKAQVPHHGCYMLYNHQNVGFQMHQFGKPISTLSILRIQEIACIVAVGSMMHTIHSFVKLG